MIFLCSHGKNENVKSIFFRLGMVRLRMVRDVLLEKGKTRHSPKITFCRKFDVHSWCSFAIYLLVYPANR